MNQPRTYIGNLQKPERTTADGDVTLCLDKPCVMTFCDAHRELTSYEQVFTEDENHVCTVGGFERQDCEHFEDHAVPLSYHPPLSYMGSPLLIQCPPIPYHLEMLSSTQITLEGLKYLFLWLLIRSTKSLTSSHLYDSDDIPSSLTLG